MPFDFSAVTSPFRMQPGLRRLADQTPQLTPNRLGERALAEKVDVLTHHHEQALLCQPDFDFRPALRALSAKACAEHPGAFSWDGELNWHAKNLGWILIGEEIRGDGAPEIGACLRAVPPLWRPCALISLAFAEDFALIDGATTTVPWLAVCLPSRWSPEEKIGQPFAQIHAPVADNESLVAASEHLARLVTGSVAWERFVWTITIDPGLSQHPKRSLATSWPDEVRADAQAIAQLAHFRTERQTFIPLIEHHQAIFTIHVQSQPLLQAISSSDSAMRVRGALATMSPAVLEYRGLTSARDRLVHWLTSRCN
jgi:hypothetical protein